MKILEIDQELLAKALHNLECFDKYCRKNDKPHLLEWVGTPEALAKDLFIELQRLKFKKNAFPEQN